MSTKNAPEKYIPKPDGLNAVFYTELASTGRLRAQACTACGSTQHPPRYRCGSCGSADFQWRDSSGGGSVVSWVTTHRDVALGWGAEVPYTTLIVELDEGCQVIGALEGDHGSLTVGARVQARVEPVTEAFARTWFRQLES